MTQFGSTGDAADSALDHATRGPCVAELVAIADDLSGACETAALFGPGARVALWSPEHGGEFTRQSATVIDTDSREIDADEAAERVASAAAALRPRPTVLFKKIDSLLRGNVRAEVEALRGPDLTMVCAPALPALGRTTVGGAVLVDGVPLHRTSLWHVERREPPRSIAELFGELVGCHCDLQQLREGELSDLLRGHRGRIVVCDAETEDDLAKIAQALQTAPPALAVGASALGRAIVTAHRPMAALPALDATEAGACEPLRAHPPRHHRLTVVGSAAQIIATQADQLLRHSATRAVQISNDQLVTADDAGLAALGHDVRAALGTDDVILTRDTATHAALPISGHELARRLGVVVASAIADHPQIDLVILGGESARAVLDILGVRELRILGEAHPGAAIVSAPDGRLACTRPGSFGDAYSLRTIHAALDTY